jgi:Holliday junction resolvase
MTDAMQLTLDGAEVPMKATGGKSNPHRGAVWERRMKVLLEQAGYMVIRAAGSHGAADLIAIRRDVRPVFVQCKIHGTVGHGEWNALLTQARECGSTPIIASRNETGKHVYLREITDYHVARSPKWPAKAWFLGGSS